MGEMERGFLLGLGFFAAYSTWLAVRAVGQLLWAVVQ